MAEAAAVEVTSGPAGEVTPVMACPIGPVVDVLFSRWTTPILWS